MYKRIKIWATVGVFLIMGLLTFIQMKTLKAQYAVTDSMTDMGNAIIYKGYEITVDSARIWNYDAFFDEIQDTFADADMWRETCIVKQPGLEMSMIDMDITVKKIDDSDALLYMNQFSLVQDSFFNGIDPLFIEALNGKSIGMNLRKGRVEHYRMVYEMYNVKQPKKDWENRASLKYGIVLTIYPEKKGIWLTQLEDCLEIESAYVYDAQKKEEEPSFENPVEIDKKQETSINNLPLVEGCRFEFLSFCEVQDASCILNLDDYDSRAWYDTTYINTETGEITDEECNYYMLRYRITNENEEEKKLMTTWAEVGIFVNNELYGATERYLSPRNPNPAEESEYLRLKPNESAEICALVCIRKEEFKYMTEKGFFFDINPWGHAITNKKTNSTIVVEKIEEE